MEGHLGTWYPVPLIHPWFQLSNVFQRTEKHHLSVPDTTPHLFSDQHYKPSAHCSYDTMLAKEKWQMLKLKGLPTKPQRLKYVL